MLNILPIQKDVQEKLEEIVAQNFSNMSIYIEAISEVLSGVEGNSAAREIEDALSGRYRQLRELATQDPEQRKQYVAPQEGDELLDALLISAATVESYELLLNAFSETDKDKFNSVREFIEKQAVEYFTITPQANQSVEGFVKLISKQINIKDEEQRKCIERKISSAFEDCKEAYSGGKPNDPLSSKLYRVSTKAFTMALKALSVAASAGLFAAQIISMMSVPADFGITFVTVGIIAKVISALKPLGARGAEQGLDKSGDTLSMTPKVRAHHQLAQDVRDISKSLLELTPAERAKKKLATVTALAKVQLHHHGKHSPGKTVKPSSTPEKDVPEGSGGKDL